MTDVNDGVICHSITQLSLQKWWSVWVHICSWRIK